MDRLTVGVLSVIGLLAYIVTMAMGLIDRWHSNYQQRRKDSKLSGRNAIIRRLMEWTPQPPDPTKRNGNMH